MSNSQITSQLTRVTVPSISDGKFADGIRSAFETINNNFKTIASLPFIQGVQGDSYTLISKDIWVEVNDNVSPVYYTLTKEGAVLLNSIFESALVNNIGDSIKFQEGDSFDECKTNKLGNLSLNGVSPIDSFFKEEIEEGKTVKKLVNNKLYFYSIINNLDEEQDTYLGQYFYFIDARITELGSVYGSEGLSEFNDFTGFYQYQPASDTEAERYNAISIVPNLYYDKYKDDICWKYNGQETGISAIGPKGLDGKDANFLIIFVSNPTETANSGDILGYYDFNEDEGKGGITTGTPVKDCFCLIQFVSTTNENGKIVITEYIDSAFGEVHSNKAYWEDEYRISKLFNNQNITRYFCSMGATSSIENHPYYFAIPSHRDRTDSSETAYTNGHVLLSSEGGDLVLQKSENAFTVNGQQQEGELTLYTNESNFNIRNYNVNIGYDDNGNRLGGDLTVVGNASIGTLDVSGSATIGGLDVDVNVDIGGNLSVSGSATIGGSGGLGVNWDANIGGDLSVDGNASIGSLEVTDGVTVTGDKDFNVNLNTGTVSLKSGGDYGINFDDLGSMEINTNDLTIDGGVSMSSSLSVTNGATINNGLTVTDGLQVTTKKPNIIDMTGGTADGKSNVLFGHNNPGNSSDDFPVQIENAGYPLVIKSTKKDGTTDPSYMVFGPADIYAVKEDKGKIVPNRLCLQDRNNYFGDVLIGRNLEIGNYTEEKETGGTGGNLIINAPFDTNGDYNKAIIIRKSDEKTSDYRDAKEKLSIFSNGNIVTEGSVEVKGSGSIGSLKVPNGAEIYSGTGANEKYLKVNTDGINIKPNLEVKGSITASGNISGVGITASGNISGVGITASGTLTGASINITTNGGTIKSNYGKITIPSSGGKPTIENGLIIKNSNGTLGSTLEVGGDKTDNTTLKIDTLLEVKNGIDVTHGYIRGCNMYSFASAWSINLGNQSIEKYDNNTGTYQTNLRVLGRSSENGALYTNNYYVINTKGAYVFTKDFPENAVINLFVPSGFDENVDIIRDVKINGNKKSPLGHSNLMNQGSHATVILGKNVKTITYYHGASETTKELEIRIPQYIFYTNSKHVNDDNFD